MGFDFAQPDKKSLLTNMIFLNSVPYGIYL